MNNTIKSATELKERIRGKQQELLAEDKKATDKKALGQTGDSANDVKDSTDAGTRAIPKDAEETAANSTLPEDNQNVDDGPGGKTMENASADVSVAGDGKTPAHTTEPSIKGANILKKIRKAANQKEKTADHAAQGDKGTDVPEVAKKTEPAQPATDSKGTVPADGKNKPAGGEKKSEEVKPTEEVKPEGEKKSEEVKPEGEKPEGEKKSEEVKPAEGAEAIEVGDNFQIRLAKIVNLATLGAAIVDNEENFKIAEDIISRQKGQDMANELLKQAKEASNGLKAEAAEEEKLASILKDATDEEKQQLVAAVQYDQLMKSATEEERVGIEKLSKLHKHNISKLATAGEKQAYAAGAQDNAVAMDQMGAMDEAGQTELPEMGDEEILAILEQLVAAGAIPPEVAAQIAELIMSGGLEGGEAGPVEEEGIVAPEGEEEIAALADESAKLADKIAS